MVDAVDAAWQPDDELWARFEADGHRHAFLSRIGANAALVRCWPEEATSAIARIAQDAGFNVVGSSKDPSYAVYFEDEDFADDRLAALADALSERGVISLAHVLAHGELLGEHVDVFRRIDSRAHDAADGVVLGRLLMGPRSETRHRDVDGWFLGAPADLLRLETRLGERFEVDRAESAAGLDGLHVETVILDEAAEDEAVDGFGAAASPVEELTLSHLIDDVADALDDVGIIGPFEVIDVFAAPQAPEGADDDGGAGDGVGDDGDDGTDDGADPGNRLED
ncbi:hypothetical protein [Actinomyces haliotis]|uniref:hypothetical protein n=1 Tax=Actinomyces haliotis TaxID=1280843 RepID=UPI00188FA9E9|nr:hypothetical protein [Actinomyces haliotis]